jgi:hypothetical protein
MGIFDFFNKKISNYQMCLLLYQLVNYKCQIDYKSLKNSTESEILKSMKSNEIIRIAEKLCEAIIVLKIDYKFQSSYINTFCETESFKQLENKQTITKQHILGLIDNCKRLSVSDLMDFLTYHSKFLDAFDKKEKNNPIIKNFFDNYHRTFQIVRWFGTAQILLLSFGLDPNADIKSRKKMFNESSEEETKMVNLKKTDNLDKLKEKINLFLNKMKDIPDWYEIIQKRGNGHAMLDKTMNIKVDDYEYWANAHLEEYMLKYNNGDLDVEGINLRIEKFGFIVAELEKVIKKAAELNLNITHEMHNDYCAARASLLGAEYALKEMTR